jgi:hypothetical protein
VKKKLLLVNLLLAGLALYAAWSLRQEWQSARAREQALLHARIKPAPPPLFTPRPVPQPVAPARYVEIAAKTLFSRDRNPTVVEDTPPPPPPKPEPPLPVVYGVMNFGDGPVAIMSDKAGNRHRGVQPGERIGDYTLLAVNDKQIVLGWEGKQITKRIAELEQKTPPPVEAASTQAAAKPPEPQGQPAPGTAMGAGIRACQKGDPSPPGTVVDGMRKVVTESPFGPVCRWEPVK